MKDSGAVASISCNLTDIFDYIIKTRPELINVSAGRENINEIFSDRDLVNSCMCLFENNLNVVLAAKKLYMHRNTLLYRIKKIKNLTGLDIKTFYGAVEFIELYRIYLASTEGTK